MNNIGDILVELVVKLLLVAALVGIVGLSLFATWTGMAEQLFSR